MARQQLHNPNARPGDGAIAAPAPRAAPARPLTTTPAPPAATSSGARQSIPASQMDPGIIAPLTSVLDQCEWAIEQAQTVLDTKNKVTFTSLPMIRGLVKGLTATRTIATRQMLNNQANTNRMAQAMAKAEQPQAPLGFAGDQTRGIEVRAAKIVASAQADVAGSVAAQYAGGLLTKATGIAAAFETDGRSLDVYRIRSQVPAVSLLPPEIVSQLTALKEDLLAGGYADILQRCTLLVKVFGREHVNDVSWLQIEAATKLDVNRMARRVYSTGSELVLPAGAFEKEKNAARELAVCYDRAATIRGGGAAIVYAAVLAKLVEVFRALAGTDYQNMSIDAISRSMRQGGGTLTEAFSDTTVDSSFVSRFISRQVPFAFTPWDPALNDVHFPDGK